MPTLIHHVHLTPQAERTRGQPRAFLARASGAKQASEKLEEWKTLEPWGGSLVRVCVLGGGAVMLFHSCQNWQFSSVFCEFTLGMA